MPALTAAALILLVGCARDMRFQAVDGASGNAIARAKVTVRKGGSLSYFYREPHLRLIGLTDTNGVITVRGLRKTDTLFFDMPGYRGAVAGLFGSAQVAIRPNPPHDVNRMDLEQNVVNNEGIIAVPLEPLSHANQIGAPR
jgi:hypothetical protein